jgi:hypothetical protein
VISYGLWLPYLQIVRANNILETYIHYYFEAVTPLFISFGVDVAAIQEVKQLAMSEIVDNPIYKYEDDSLPPPDLSDIVGSSQ